MQDVAGVRIPFGYGLAGAAAASGSIINVTGSMLTFILQLLRVFSLRLDQIYESIVCACVTETEFVLYR